MRTQVILFGLLISTFGTCLAVQPSPPILELAEPQHSESKEIIETTSFGAAGDGKTDDTIKLQKALTACSEQQKICRIPEGKTHRVTKPLFLWGDASLVAEKSGGINIDFVEDPIVLHLGISRKSNPAAPSANLKKPFSGSIRNIKFSIVNAKPILSGRVLYFWRTNGSRIENNLFDLGSFNFSAMSSGNNHEWVASSRDCIRRSIAIINNTVLAKADDKGAEGIAIDHFDTAIIAYNTVIGVGDDPIAVHLSQNVKVLNNIAESVDGRIFVSNSKNVEIANNTHKRVASSLDNRFYKGISLIYIGFENYSINTKNFTKYSAPENIHIHGNSLHYPEGAVDGNGAAIFVYAPRNVTIEKNIITNDSETNHPSLYGIYVAPVEIPGWKDPAGIDNEMSNRNLPIARVHNASIENNKSSGKNPLPFIMTGNCVYYVGELRVSNNSGAPKYEYYCFEQGVKLNNNQR